MLERVERVLIVKEPWLSLLLSGEKTWEIRGSSSAVRGLVGLAGSGSGVVGGVGRLVGATGPFQSVAEFREAEARHHVRLGSESSLPYGERTHAWHFAEARRLRVPVPFTHRPGAVIWVRPSEQEVEQLTRAAHVP